MNISVLLITTDSPEIPHYGVAMVEVSLAFPFHRLPCVVLTLCIEDHDSLDVISSLKYCKFPPFHTVLKPKLLPFLNVDQIETFDH